MSNSLKRKNKVLFLTVYKNDQENPFKDLIILFPNC